MNRRRNPTTEESRKRREARERLQRALLDIGLKMVNGYLNPPIPEADLWMGAQFKAPQGIYPRPEPTEAPNVITLTKQANGEYR